MSGSVGVRFPENHPIMSYPKGQRSWRVRELVDMGLAIKDTLFSINEHLKLLSERLSQIECKLESSGVTKFEVTKNQLSDNSQVKVDLEAFSDL